MNEDEAAVPLDVRRVRPQPSCLVPPGIDSWVSLSGSMTRAVTAVCGCRPEVLPLFEGPGEAAPWERRVLGSRQRRVYLRQIALIVDGAEMIQARTVALLGDPALVMLRRLGRAPLAEVLFSDERWRRPGPPIPLTVKTVGGGRPAPAWGRACLWQFSGSHGGRVLVEEYFLPALLQRGNPLARTMPTS